MNCKRYWLRGECRHCKESVLKAFGITSCMSSEIKPWTLTFLWNVTNELFTLLVFWMPVVYGILFIFDRVEPGVPAVDEPKFIVFYSMLMILFTKFCFNCKSDTPFVSVKANGTMATVQQHCKCCGKDYKWHSQPFILGRYPAGNILLSFGTLMAGASISKLLLICKHMGLSVFSARTFFHHQTKFLFPVIIKHWTNCTDTMIRKLKDIPKGSWCGDGSFDSMGHSAKFGTYSMFSANLCKIVHFELVQVW